jgi:probable phosphoglycerate mutase
MGKTDGEMLAVGLSTYGQMQARAVGKELRHRRVECIFASPIARANETAQLISRVAHVPMVLEENLREFIASPDEHDPVRMRNLKLQAYADPDYVAPSGESLAQSAQRFVQVFNTIASKNYSAVCIVSHRMVMEAVLANMFGYNVGKHDWLHTASLTAITVGADAPEILFANQPPKSLTLTMYRLLRKVGMV